MAPPRCGPTTKVNLGSDYTFTIVRNHGKSTFARFFPQRVLTHIQLGSVSQLCRPLHLTQPLGIITPGEAVNVTLRGRGGALSSKSRSRFHSPKGLNLSECHALHL